MKRRWLTIAATMSAVACAVFVAARIRVIFAQDAIAWERAGGRSVVIRTTDDNLELIVVNNWPEAQPTRWTRTPPGIAPGVRFGSSRDFRRHDCLGITVFHGDVKFRPASSATALFYPTHIIHVGLNGLILYTLLLPGVWITLRVVRIHRFIRAVDELHARRKYVPSPHRREAEPGV